MNHTDTSAALRSECVPIESRRMKIFLRRFALVVSAAAVLSACNKKEADVAKEAEQALPAEEQVAPARDEGGSRGRRRPRRTRRRSMRRLPADRPVAGVPRRFRRPRTARRATRSTRRGSRNTISISTIRRCSMPIPTATARATATSFSPTPIRAIRTRAPACIRRFASRNSARCGCR